MARSLGHRLTDHRAVIWVLIAAGGLVWAYYLTENSLLLWSAGGAVLLQVIGAFYFRWKDLASLPLFLVHVGLLAALVVIGLGQTTWLKAKAEVPEGEWFEGEAFDIRQGTLHPHGLNRVRFQVENVAVDYRPGVRRARTRAHVRWQDHEGQWKQQVVTDTNPLVMDGYRLYPSHNKGFALVFDWQPSGSQEIIRGSVNLPPYPINEYAQNNTFALPGVEDEIWAGLEVPDNLIRLDETFTLTAPKGATVVVRWGAQRQVLTVGQAITLPGGTLRLHDIRMWSGFFIFYDLSRYWLLSALLIMVAGMAAHYWQTLRRKRS